MLHCSVMIDKHTDTSCNHSHSTPRAQERIPSFVRFFTLHRLIKPQRPQSVELRSTLQRNNMNVLRIGTIQSKLGEGRKPCSERGVLSLPKKTEGAKGNLPLTTNYFKEVSMKHKVKTILFAGLALIALFGMTACPNNAGGGGGGSSGVGNSGNSGSSGGGGNSGDGFVKI